MCKNTRNSILLPSDTGRGRGHLNPPKPSKDTLAALHGSGGYILPYLSWSKREEERAAIIEYEANAPRDWAEALAQLDRTKPPAEITRGRWLLFLDDCGRFLDGNWANCARALGWEPLDLFGCDRRHPLRQLSRAGLLWLVAGGRLIAMSAELAVVERDDHERRKYARLGVQSGVVLAWQLVSRGTVSDGSSSHPIGPRDEQSAVLTWDSKNEGKDWL
jgi:hypothetical protein